MNEFEDAQHQPPLTVGSQTTALFLALYLLVLAFFIILVTISTTEDVKSKAVMDSLSSTFSSLLPPSTDLTAFIAKEGDVLAGQAFQEQVTGIFSTAVQVTKIEVVQPGRLMRVTVPTKSFFLPGSTDIREAQFPLLDRIVATLSVSTPGLRYDMEFIIGNRLEPGDQLPTGQTLSTERAGVFARAMFARGVPPDSVAIGLKPGSAGEIAMRFYVRNREETRLRFEKILKTSEDREAAE